MSITINATFDSNHAYELSYPDAAQAFAAQLHLAADPHCTTPGLPDIAKLGTDELLNMYTHACRNPYRSQRLVDRRSSPWKWCNRLRGMRIRPGPASPPCPSRCPVLA